MADLDFSNAYIRDLDGDGSIMFQFLPTDTSESKAARYTDHEILGRSTPITAYQGSDSRIITLTLRFFTQPFQSDDSMPLEEINDKINWLRSLVYPDYSNGIAPPHRVLLRLSNLIAMVAVVTDYAFNPSPSEGLWQLPGPTFIHYAEMKLTFKEVRSIPYDLNDIRSGTASSDSQQP